MTALLPPSLSGLRVLELGAGIGRFTGLLAATAAHVHAVDFMPNLIEEARPAAAPPPHPGSDTQHLGMPCGLSGSTLATRFGLC